MTRREGVFIELVNQAMEKPLAAQPFALHVGGQEVSIAQRWLYFPEYNGPPPKDSRQDPVVGPPNRPFAALQVVERLENEGFVAGWFDGRHKLLSTWEPRRELMPSQSAQAIFARMKVWGKESGGYWDVFAWEPELRFIHLMRDGSLEMISVERLRWLEMALADGISSSAFEIWRWFGGALEGRVLRLTDYTYDRLTGWAEWKDGRITYTDDGVRDMVDHYRGWGARTEADRP